MIQADTETSDSSEQSSEQKRNWQERWGVADFEAYHWITVVGLGELLLAPFLAIVQPIAGAIALTVGGLLDRKSVV